MGFRGVPANYGGFETFVEEFGPRLVDRGHEVTVYNRANWIPYRDPMYKGMRLRWLPTVPHKYLDTIIHTLLSSIHAAFMPFDAVLILNGANAPFAIFPRLAGKKVIINVDGIERKRQKWNKLGKAYLKVNERIATIAPHEIVTDAQVIHDYYRDCLDTESTMIPYGANVGREPQPDIVRELGLEPDKYILYVARLEPENNAHTLIQAFEGVKTNMQLAIVGDAPYAKDYIAKLKSTPDSRIVFLGFVFGEGYRALQQSAFAFVQATEVGGTHPALLEAMAFGNYVIANGTPENVEVLGDAGVTYAGVAQLQSEIQRVVNDPRIREPAQSRAMERIKLKYGWNQVVEQYERLFQRMTGHDSQKNCSHSNTA